jgi:dipeptidyl aminopeptidase/acylaminoacyl peptidase
VNQIAGLRRSLPLRIQSAWTTCYVAFAIIACLSLFSFAGAAERTGAKIESEGDCYRFQTYEAWVDFIKERAGSSPNFSLEEFRQRNPQQQYDGFRKSITCTFFRYSINGVEIGGFSARPKDQGTERKKLPVIIYNRGGSGEGTAVTFGQMLADIFPLAAQGFLVIGSQYRQQDEFGGKDVDDVMALFDIIDLRSDVDHERIGMMGWSRGGVMTMLAAARTTRVKAIALGGTPTDLLKGLESRPDMEAVFKQRIPDYSSNKEAALTKRSPLFVLDKVAPSTPILILHGSADARAPAEHALWLAVRLNSLKRTYKLVIYPNGNHALNNFREDVRDELGRWFLAYLTDSPPRPQAQPADQPDALPPPAKSAK